MDITWHGKLAVVVIGVQDLEAEMTERLGYGKHAASTGENAATAPDPRRCAHREVGAVQFDVPRDRDGPFQPKTVAKATTVGRDRRDRAVADGAGLTCRRRLKTRP